MTRAGGLDVSFHELEFRPDRDEWIVGRQGTDEIVALPGIGMDAIRLLSAGRTVEETRSSLRASTGRDVDVRAFVERLASAGLVASIGERRFPVAPAAVSFPRVRPHHVRLLLNPVLHAVLLLVPVAGLAVALTRPGTFPSWDSFLWTEYGTFTVLVQCVIGWCLIALHEAAHLLTARATGVRGRIRLGTRLQFLVAQTEVSGIWLKGRRARLTVYLSGIVLDAVIWGGCLLARAWGADFVLLPVVVATLFLALANQCLVFMRTDLYFVVQDLTGCRNLFTDTTRYLRHVAALPFGRRAPHPLRSLPARERRFVKGYAVAVAVGSVVCLAIGLRVLTEVTWPLLRRSLVHMVDGSDWWLRLDALATVLVLCGMQTLWARLWWKRHGDRVGRARRAARRWRRDR
ncbi:hypothetical protein ACFV1R_20295 [Streptomyces coelicoflavus]|uniref:hypothetical protein n=1 Tax=Streptomyces coelicoflavus TaxID=285562 RepID=UPI0036C9ED26